MVREDPSSDRTRENLLEAAGQVFAEVGFRSATVREICARAHANIAAVNYHFGDKLGLYTEVLKSSVGAQQSAALDISLAHADPRDALRALIQQLFERMQDAHRPAWYVRIMAHELAEPTPALDRFVADVMGPNYLRFRTLVGTILGRSPEDEQTRLGVHSIIGQILHYAHARPVLARIWPGLKLEKEEERRRVAEHIAAFSLSGLDALSKAGHEPETPKRKRTSPGRNKR